MSQKTVSVFDKIVRLCWRCLKGSCGNDSTGLCLECRRTTQQMRDHYPYVLAVFNLTENTFHARLQMSEFNKLKKVM